MDILEMAKQLGKALEESEQRAAVFAAEEIQNNDEKAQQLIGEYNLKRMQIMQRMQKEELDDEGINAVRQEMAEEFDKLMQYDIIKNYIDAKDEFDKLYDQVKNIIEFYVNGEKQGGCSGSCSTCGGCK